MLNHVVVLVGADSTDCVKGDNCKNAYFVALSESGE